MLRTALKKKIRTQNRVARSTAYQAKRAEQRRALRIYGMMRSGTTQQAIRTGGWANPSRAGELKFCDVSTTLNLNLAGTFSNGVLLNAIASGTDASGRIGRKVILKSLVLRWGVQLASTSTGGGNIRILIVYDKQANATAPAITDILLTDNYFSNNNLSNRDRFVTLCDVITSSIGTGGDYSVAGKEFKELNLETMYNAGTDALIGSITSGSVYIFAAQTGTIGTAVPVVQYRNRIRYSDI